VLSCGAGWPGRGRGIRVNSMFRTPGTGQEAQ